MKKSFTEEQIGSTTLYEKIRNESGEIVYREAYIGKILIAEKKHNKNFSMIFADLWKYTGLFAIDFLIYLIRKAAEHRDNKITCISDEKIARDFNKTKKTISNTKHILHDAGILKYETKMIFMNPRLIYRGNPAKRLSLITEYDQYKGIGDEEESKKGSSAGRTGTLGTMESPETVPDDVQTEL